MSSDTPQSGSRLLDRPLDRTRIKVDFNPADFGMMAVTLDLLAADAPCPVDLFLPLYSLETKQAQMERVADKGEPFRADWREKLIAAEQSKVYAPLDQSEQLSDYFDEHAGKLLDASNMTTRKRAKYVQELAAVNLNSLFGGDLSNESVETSATRAHETVRRMTNDLQVLKSLAGVLRSDHSIYSHSINVCMLSMAFGRFLGLSPGRIQALGVGGLLHDAGMSKLPAYLLDKSDGLSAQEIAMVRRHPRLGYKMLLQISSVSYDALMIVLHHHENADGSGYPSGLRANRIPYLARLVRVADSYDTMTSKRSLSGVMTAKDAAATLLGPMAAQLGSGLATNFVRFLASPFMR